MKEKEDTFNFHMWKKTEHYCSYIDFFPPNKRANLVCVCVCMCNLQFLFPVCFKNFNCFMNNCILGFRIITF